LVFYRPKKAGVFKIPAFEFAFVGKKYKVEKQKVWVFKAQDDGRFTLGAGERRLMYGFPIPLSTSHFVVKADNNFASNSYSVRAAQHITTAKRETITEGNSKYVQMRYYFNHLVIVQKIIPVTANLKLAEENEKVQYYQVVYEIENTDSKEKEVGLTLLIDTMIDGNDAAQIGVANESKLFDTEVVLKDSLPERLWVYEKAGNTSKMIGELRNSIDTEKVNEVYIGKWSQFFTTLWDVKLSGEKYKDSGILVRWTSRKIAPKAKTVLSVYYGLPDFKMAGKNNSLGLLFDEPEMIESVEDVLYYTGGSPELTTKQATKIDKMLKKIPLNDILGISIEGYSDASGNAEQNYLLSIQRAISVAEYLKKQGIAAYRLMPKGYGDSFARPNYDKLKNAEDRKVVLRIVYKAK
jgi:outer membrane protein OmpA-like peptidoglycan-associated protein